MLNNVFKVHDEFHDEKAFMGKCISFAKSVRQLFRLVWLLTTMIFSPPRRQAIERNMIYMYTCTHLV